MLTALCLRRYEINLATAALGTDEPLALIEN